MRHIILILSILLYPTLCISQIFYDAAPDLGIVQYNWDGFFGAGCSTADWNRDGWDDLTFGNTSGALRTYKNDGNGGYEVIPLPVLQQAETKAIHWVDIDEDYDLDLFVSDRYGKMCVVENLGDTAFVDVTSNSGLSTDSTETAGASWGDYDNDGDLDLHICRYIENSDLTDPIYKNALYRNNGDFTFTDVSSEAQIDLYVRLSFQSIWYDWDGDGWQDIYVINDKESPNAFYHNQQNGQFTEISSSIGLDLILDAMTASMADFNQDGFQDIFMTSTDIPNEVKNDGHGSKLLLGSENGHYTEASSEYGLNFIRFCWGSVWMDVDNDTDLDLFIAESHPLSPFLENFLYENQGSWTENSPFQNNYSEYYMTEFGTDVWAQDFLNSYSVASGDFNRDGWVDFIVHNKDNHKARVWMNQGFDENPTNYIQFGVKGIVSNTMGVGAWVEVTDDDLTQRRVIHCGENYLGQESFYEHFGLGEGEFEPVEEVRIEWPSGIVDVWYGVEEQDRRVFVEGASACDEFDNSPIDLCAEDGLLSAELEWEGDVVWALEETGEILGEGNLFNPTSPGNYSFTVYYESVELCSKVIEVSGYGLSADINNSGVVDSIDLLDFLTSYGCIGACETDINLDGQTTVDDLLQLLVEYGDSAC